MEAIGYRNLDRSSYFTFHTSWLAHGNSGNK